MTLTLEAARKLCPLHKNVIVEWSAPEDEMKQTESGLYLAQSLSTEAPTVIMAEIVSVAADCYDERFGESLGEGDQVLVATSVMEVLNKADQEVRKYPLIAIVAYEGILAVMDG